MPLDQPLDRIQPEPQLLKPQSKAGLIIELSLAICFVIGILICDVFGFPRSYELALISGLLLALAYLFANWWLNKPALKSARTILLTILFGFTSFVLLIALIFRFLYLPGEYEMRIFSLAILIISSFVDGVTSVNKVKVTNTRTKWRFLLLAGAIVLYTFIDQDKRIRFTYRNDQEFINYYESQRSTLPFHEIEESYFKE